ncbi:LPS export ABC transporter periplasmic protein LptC [Campylobacter sp. 19-13652]|uniref:LPS export ABC transporter periplasmic protein LptC n=1 Tax=Campylobacter sp. 19-13652 TaxID=2840180 RepID=UPI001C796B59|nr:LPS export ABC transporter periplasmic protein LptC [Campylobacter sp. 19-13652]BCX79070.1 hypothetical protein LBC_05320 [Campylobacter sp. 19-13652]
MVIKLFYTLVVIFGVAMVFVVAQDPYIQDEFIQDPSISSLEVLDATTYELSSTRVVGVYTSSRINRYKDHDEFKDFKASYIANDLKHTLSSNIAIKRENELEFRGAVFYENSDDTRLNSEVAMYNISTKVAQVPSLFTLWRGDGVKVIGKNLKYLPTKEITAQEVNAWVWR